MNSQESNSPGRGEENTSSKLPSPTPSNSTASSLNIGASEGMKRAAARQLIERYYYQLTDGCGRNNCSNTYCASSPTFMFLNISKNTAAVRAIDLLKDRAELCDPSNPSKVAKNGSSSTSPTHDGSGSSGVHHADTPGTSEGFSDTKLRENSASSLAKLYETTSESQPFLNEQRLLDIILECELQGNFSKLNRIIGSVFNNYKSLMKSFCMSSVSKEEIRAMEVDQDKDTNEKMDDTDPPYECIRGSGNSSVHRNLSYKVTIDIASIRRTFSRLFNIPDLPFQAALINALIYLSRDIEIDLKYHHEFEKDPNLLNVFITVMEIPVLHTPEFIEKATPQFCKVLGQLPLSAQTSLCHFWSHFSKERLKEMVDNLQQLITVKVISTNWTRTCFVNDDDGIAGAVRVMRILYYASMLAGEMDDPTLIASELVQNVEAEEKLHELLQGAVGHEGKEKVQPKQDPLAKELGINCLNFRNPAVSWEDFINEPLSDQIEMEREYRDYQIFKHDNDTKFAFLAHPFILTTAIKNQGMNFDNRVRMLNERRQSIVQSLMHGGPTMPYLRIKIRRDHIIADALVALELVAMDNPQDLKKQLYVEFEGEQGIDEGGVSKEFFQLVVEEIFNPDIGMFTYDEETRRFWFNPTSFENDGQFTLIGIVLGLAIYNNVILDVHFPMVVYRKLMGKLGVFGDLKDSHQGLAKGLEDLLSYNGNVEEEIMQTFRITYKDIFGSNLTYDLKDDGDKIPVTAVNRQEFVDLYADFLLNKAIDRQFRAFKRGFQMVTDESPLRLFFRPEEVELLVCGSKKFDFFALEEATDYDGGFTPESPAIRNFWEIVHEMDEVEKRKLLQFTTGSDRVPVGGLSKLKLIIARNGPDSDRLPTSHTCFNVLLLPDYGTKEKLLERLTKAISYAKGFGML